MIFLTLTTPPYRLKVLNAGVSAFYGMSKFNFFQKIWPFKFFSLNTFLYYSLGPSIIKWGHYQKRIFVYRVRGGPNNSVCTLLKNKLWKSSSLFKNHFKNIFKTMKPFDKANQSEVAGAIDESSYLDGLVRFIFLDFFTYIVFWIVFQEYACTDRGGLGVRLKRILV